MFREKDRLKKQVTAIRQMGGGTNTHKPLEFAKKNMFTTQRGDRKDKRNVCIVITDGQSYDPAKTAAAAKAVSYTLPNSKSENLHINAPDKVKYIRLLQSK